MHQLRSFVGNFRALLIGLIYKRCRASLMALHTLRELPFLTVHFDFLNGWIYADWRGTLEYEQILAGAEAVLECVRSENCHKLLNDNTHVHGLALGMEDLSSMQVMPLLHAAGVEFVAWVYPPDEYSRMAVDNSVNLSVRPVALPFETLDVATSWLQHM